MGKIDTEWLKMRLAIWKATPRIEESVAEGYMWAIEELLAYREGYSPAERLPEVGQTVWLEFVDEDETSAPGAWDADESRWICYDKYAWMIKRDNVKRWYPVGPGGPGGE